MADSITFSTGRPRKPVEAESKPETEAQWEARMRKPETEAQWENRLKKSSNKKPDYWMTRMREDVEKLTERVNQLEAVILNRTTSPASAEKFPEGATVKKLFKI